MNTGDIIAMLRKEQGYTRTDFANKIGIPHTTLRNYELNKREPGHSFIIQMAQEFNVSTDFLLGLTADRNGMYADSIAYNTKGELSIIKKYRRLNDSGKEYIESQFDYALSQDKYTQDDKHEGCNVAG